MKLHAVSLHTKLMLALTMLVAAVVAGSAYFEIERERGRRLLELEARATEFADLLSRSLAHPLWNVDFRAIDHQLAALSDNAEVVEFSVTAVNYGLVSTVSKARPAGTSDTVVRVRPIEYAAFQSSPAEKIGEVRVVLSRAVTDAAIASFRRAILLIAITTIISLYVATFVLLKWMVRGPVNRLEGMVDRIAGGDLDARCAVESGDELGRLAMRVNAMAARLRESMAQLRESERKYRGIFDTVGVSIWEEDFSDVKAAIDELKSRGIRDIGQYLAEHPDFAQHAISRVKVVDVNEATIRLFKAQDKEEILVSLHKIITEEATEAFAKVLVAVAEGSAQFEAETSLQTLMGEKLTALFTITFPPQSDPFDSVLVTVTDITERKRAEEELRRSEAYLAEAESVSKSGSWAWNHITGEITYWSQQRYRLFGFDPKAGIPSFEALLQRIHPEDRAKWLENAETAVRKRGDSEIDFRIVLPDGEVKHLHGVGHPVFSKSGDLVEIIGAAMDITENKRAEEALRESEEQWKAVFENNPTMYFMVDAAGTILSVNPYGAEQLGYTVSELTGSSVLNIFHEADREAVQRNAVICLEQLGRTMSWELRKIRKDGSMLWVRETARAVLMRNQPVILIVCEDITERKRASEALREAQQELARVNRVTTMGQLAASIAHEVNQPIAAVVTHAHAALRWLSATPPDLEETRQALGHIVKDGNRASEVIGRIRALIKKIPPRNDPLNINEVIRETIALTRNELVRNSISLQSQLGKGLPLVQGDRVQLQQVILNLILNAIEAMGSTDKGARTLLIRTEEDRSRGVLVEVHDTGPGLEVEHLDDLFNAFYTTKPGGMGMGLSICRSIIEAHGGRVWATTNKPKGAVFRFTLPPRQDAAS
ncbi:PAS domain S-box protein [Microvirga vignae]|uniref:PAS domain S-box protein n=1 Tax=Microvirga vignae TaxID=1225564 RepID=UPI0012376FA4|nr:PAS domain S-box protein [Microvirga vignae]